jgi:hypothetical protein
MPDTLQEAPIWDWAAWTIVDGELATQATADLFIPFDGVNNLSDYTTRATQAQAASGDVIGAAEAIVMNELLAYMQDLAAEEIVPFGEESAFFLSLEYNYNQPSIPTTGNIAAFLTPYVQQWAAARGYNPGPDYVAPPPPTLPSPSQGEKSVVTQGSKIAPSTVTGGTPEGVSGDQVSTALAITFNNAMEVLAKVIDDMLPNLAPGQVPQALDQLNSATTVLERQIAGVMSDININVKGSLAGELNGALQTLHGLAQEVNTLADDVAMKADSKIGDDVNANTAAIAALSTTVGTVVGSSIPDLANGLGTLTSTVGSLDTEVNTEIKPQLSQVTDETNANTQMLSGTDKDCLDQLCDAEGNVINPIKDGNATPGLLKKLGSLLGVAWLASALLGIGDAIVTLLDAPLALQAVSQDVEQLASWAESAATSIEANL